MTVNISGQPDTRQNAAQPSRLKRMGRKQIFLLGLSLVLVLLVVAAGTYYLLRPRVQPLSLPALPSHLTMADMGLGNWQDYQRPLPSHPLNNQTLQPVRQDNPDQILLEDAIGKAFIQQGNIERGLTYLKAAVESAPDNLRYTNDYRVALRDHQQYQDEETFFASLETRNKTPNSMVNLALVYVDEMRSCPKPPDGLVCQAQYSSRSIDVLNTVLTLQPYNIVARFARGLNHLYWPTLMGHLPNAREDLQYAVALQKRLQETNTDFAVQAYTALGDVFAKDGKIDQARNIWLNGKNAFPNASILDARLAIPRDQLVAREDGPLRGLGVYVDTDITLFWSKER